MTAYDELIQRIHREIQGELDRGLTFGPSPFARIVREWSPQFLTLRPDRMTLFGMPVIVDPAMPPGELRLIDEDGRQLRIINIGEE